MSMSGDFYLWVAPGKPLTDRNGVQLQIGQMVTDDLFGDGFVKAVIPLDGGESWRNVVIAWHEPCINSKPYYRRNDYLTVKFGKTGGTTVQQNPKF